MEVKAWIPIGLALVLSASALPASLASVLPPPVPECSNQSDDWDPEDGDADMDDNGCDGPNDPSERRHGRYEHCPHSSPHAHTYGSGGSAGAKSDTATGGDEAGAGVVTVTDGNAVDCDNNGTPGDFDGDYDSGVGGAFFGYGPWADEPICNYGLWSHGGAVISVNDVAFGSDIWFTIGADDTSGPVITPVTDPTTGQPTGEFTCETDGSITPGDPATDPTADADDCLTEPQNLAQGSTGETCGAGGDGGYWVFLSGLLVTEGVGGVGANNPPTAGTITA